MTKLKYKMYMSSSPTLFVFVDDEGMLRAKLYSITAGFHVGAWHIMTPAHRDLGDQMLAHRERLVQLFGDRYPEKIRPWKDIIGKLARRYHCGPIAAIPKILDHMRDIDRPVDASISWIAAAAIDLECERKAVVQ